MSASENLKDDGGNGGEISASRRSLPSDRHRTAEDMAPDGGWGWFVFVGTTFTNIITFGSVTSVGMIYGEFLTDTGNDGSALATMNVMYMASFTFSGLFCNELLKRYNIKSIGVLGALIYAGSSTLVPFMPSVGYMAITGFLQGIGAGIMICIINTSLNSYFVKRKAMVFTMSQLIFSTATIFIPSLAEHLLLTYGFRGCLFILAGISYNAVCGMLTVEPVKMHSKKPKLGLRRVRPDCDAEMNEKELFDNAQNIDPKMNLLGNAAYGWEINRSLRSITSQAGNGKPLLSEASTVSDPSQNHLVSSFDLETGCHPRTSYRGSNQEVFSNRISLLAATSMASMSNVGELNHLEHPIVKTEAKDKTGVIGRIKSILADFFEVSLLHDGVYVNMCFGMTFICTADANFISFLPLILTDDGFTTTEVALLLTVAAIAEVVSRILLATFVMFFDTKARHIFFGAVCALLLSRIAFLYCHTLTSLIVIIVIINLVRSWCLVVQGLVIAEYFQIERFTAAWGLYGVLMGGLQLIVTPSVGFIKDWTRSYVVMQCVLLGAIALCIISWAVNIWICDILPKYRDTSNIKIDRSRSSL